MASWILSSQTLGNDAARVLPVGPFFLMLTKRMKNYFSLPDADQYCEHNPFETLRKRKLSGRPQVLLGPILNESLKQDWNPPSHHPCTVLVLHESLEIKNS